MCCIVRVRSYVCNSRFNSGANAHHHDDHIGPLGERHSGRESRGVKTPYVKATRSISYLIGHCFYSHQRADEVRSSALCVGVRREWRLSEGKHESDNITS